MHDQWHDDEVVVWDNFQWCHSKQNSGDQEDEDEECTNQLQQCCFVEMASRWTHSFVGKAPTLNWNEMRSDRSQVTAKMQTHTWRKATMNGDSGAVKRTRYK